MRRILITDDEPAILRAYRRVLERSGFEVATADTGDEALEVLSRGDIHALITDVCMPGISGLELARRVRALHPAMPVIVLTGRSNATDESEARESAARYLLKPYPPNDLIALLKRMLDVL